MGAARAGEYLQGQLLLLPPGHDLDLRYEARVDPVASDVGQWLLLIAPDQKQAETVAGLINLYTRHLHLDS